LEKYFDQGTLEDSDVLPNIGKAIAASKLCPVYAVSTTTWWACQLCSITSSNSRLTRRITKPNTAKTKKERKSRGNIRSANLLVLLLPHDRRSVRGPHQRLQDLQWQSRHGRDGLQLDARHD
jgi:hypothetical protein